jgi:nucleoside-triphosphatase THEP1
MQLAYVMADGPGGTDRLLSSLAAELSGRGVTLAGVVQTNTPREATHRCDMDVRVLPDGATHCISQSLGAHARGCRLDPAALDRAVEEVRAGFPGAAELLIVNKFGKHEAEGRGFRDLIAEALARDVPVLCGVGRLNEAAFHAFAGDLARRLPPDLRALHAWVAEARGEPTRAAQ